MLETERLRLNGSVTELRLPEHSPGSSYAVTIRGVTAAGAGAALMREFHGNSGSGELCRVAGPGAWARTSRSRQPALPEAAPLLAQPCRRSFPGCPPADTPRPQGIRCRSARDIAPSQGTAVLPLRPIARGSEAAR